MCWGVFRRGLNDLMDLDTLTGDRYVIIMRRHGHFYRVVITMRRRDVIEMRRSVRTIVLNPVHYGARSARAPHVVSRD